MIGLAIVVSFYLLMVVGIVVKSGYESGIFTKWMKPKQLYPSNKKLERKVKMYTRRWVLAYKIGDTWSGAHYRTWAGARFSAWLHHICQESVSEIHLYENESRLTKHVNKRGALEYGPPYEETK